MSLTSTKRLENNMVELNIAVSPEKLEEATTRAYRRKAKTITVPGFRKGKAPRTIIEKMYGEDIFMQDAIEELYPSAYKEAVEEAGIEPVNAADLEILSADRENGFAFKATVTVKPEVTVGPYKELKAEKILYAATDEGVDAEIGRMQERGARLVTVEDRAAENEDITTIDFEGFVDGVPFEGGKGDGYQLTLGSHQFIDGFEEQIVGRKTGDEFDVNVTFPEEYHSEELKGKPALFKVKLHEIKAKELPELDDEFAKDVSEFDTLAELREDVRRKIQENMDERSRDELENDLMGQVIDSIEADIPECMFENKINDMVRDFEYRLSGQGMSLDLYLQYTGMELDSFRKTFREQAERQVKIRLALEKIAEMENFTVSDEDYSAEIEKLTAAYGMETKQVEQIVPRKDLEADIRCTKAIDLIRDTAKVTETKVEDIKLEPEESEEKSKAKKTAKKPAEKKTEAKKPAEKKPAAKKPAAKKPAAKKESEPEEQGEK